MRPEKIVLASGNQKKLGEISHILDRFHINLIAQTDLNIGEAVEDGLTFVENAIKKARHACAHTGLPAIADDSGIEVDYLQGAPGIYSARFSGEDATDESNLDHLLEKLQGVTGRDRKARYYCVIVYMKHTKDPTPLICQASWDGVLLEQKQGKGGFGYDPIFFLPSEGKTAAQMSAEEKSSMSHRAKALALFQKQFELLYP